MSLIIEKKEKTDDISIYIDLMVDSIITLSNKFEYNYFVYKEFNRLLLNKKKLIWANRFNHLAFTMESIPSDVRMYLANLDLKIWDNVEFKLEDFSEFDITDMINHIDNIENDLMLDIENVISDMYIHNLHRFSFMLNKMLKVSCGSQEEVVGFKRLNKSPIFKEICDE